MEILQYEFMQRALIAGFLAAISCGIIGVYVVVKKMVFISGGISHASFGGIGLGYLLGINPILGVLFFAPLAALVMGLTIKRTKLPEDTAIGILWAMGWSLGVIFIGLTSGYTIDPFSYLIGNILIVPLSDLILMLILDIVIVITVFLLYKEFLAISFDEEFGEVVGVPVEILYLLLLLLISLTVVVLIQVVGIILVIALLTIPAAAARQYTHTLNKMMFISILFGAIFTTSGLLISYKLDIVPGATIVLVSGIGFILSYLFSSYKKTVIVEEIK